MQSADRTALPASEHVAFAITELERVDRTAIIAVEGELDLSNGPSLREALDDVLAEEHSGVVLDLSAVTFIDSTALRLLLDAQRQIREVSVMPLVCTNRNVLRIFKIAGLDGAFEIFPSLEEALWRAREEDA